MEVLKIFDIRGFYVSFRGCTFGQTNMAMEHGPFQSFEDAFSIPNRDFSITMLVSWSVP